MRKRAGRRPAPPSCSTSSHSAARRAAGGQQVVVDEHARARGDRVGVELERVGAVLEQVLGPDGLVRQLAGLAREHEAGAELARDRRPEQEAARLGADDDVDAAGRARGRPARRPPRRAPSGEARTGVMSLKTIPGFGKSGMSRTSASRSTAMARLSADDLAQVADEQQVLEVRRDGREVLQRLDRLLAALGVARAQRRGEDLLQQRRLAVGRRCGRRAGCARRRRSAPAR